MEPKRIAALLLAAGSASRMRGRDKLLETIDGQSILRKLTRQALNSRCDNVFVAIPAGNAARYAELAGLKAEAIGVPDPTEGMGASIRAGISGIGSEFDAVVILLSDMPEITSEIIDDLIAAYDPDLGAQICRATAADGRPGHPVLFGSRYFQSLQNIKGDQGARNIIATAQGYVVNIATDDKAATTDLDTPEAWAEWRASRKNRAR